MLSGLRRLINSVWGKLIALGFLVVIGLAFALADIGNVRTGAAATGDSVAQVADTKITETELQRAIRAALEQARQRNPNLDMNALIAAGGVGQLLDDLIDNAALAEFGTRIGLNPGDKAIDAEIASAPAFRGLSGQFDQAALDQFLSRRRITLAELRRNIGNDMVRDWLTLPTIGSTQVPNKVVLPYASQLLEERSGQAGFVPIQAFGMGDPPTPQQLQTFYQRNRARYTIPERRAIRYAVVQAETLRQGITVSDAEVQKAYAAAGQRYAASEKRTLGQVIAADQATANRIAQAVRGGQTLTAAARAAGLEASTLTDTTRPALAGQSADAVATAAFGAAQDAVVGPVQSPLGWHVLRVERITRVAGKSVAEAREELVKELTDRKLADQLNALQDKVNDAITANGTFDEIVADAKLSAQKTAPLLGSGIDPEQPQAQPDPLAAQLASAAFAINPGDAPQIAPLGDDGSFAVVALDRVVEAAPPPLARIEEGVRRDFIVERALGRARQTAAAIIKKVDGGATLAEAFASAGVTLPKPEPVNASRLQLMAIQQQNQGRVPAPLALMFSMAPKKAKLTEEEARRGYYVVYLDSIKRGDATGNTQLIQRRAQELGQTSGRELAQQFVRAVQKDVGVSRNQPAIDRVTNGLRAGAATGSAAQ
ncbi:SurA N-terminal domain-containing protein [Sphingomonas sp. CJ99]